MTSNQQVTGSSPVWCATITIGEWKDDKFHGQGTYTYDNGDVFEGEYKDGVQLNGTAYDKDGNILYKKVNGELE